MSDFDVDFSDQDAVFEDLQRKYGEENVARIIAFGTLTPKNVTRKVLNAFGFPQQELNQISKLIADDAKTMKDAYEASEELRRYKSKYKVEFEVIERLEGIVSHESQHAGGVIIYPNLSSVLPLKSKASEKSKRIVAFDKYMLEEMGHYKFDILGLETLPVIRRTLDSIEEVEGKHIELDEIDLDDAGIYEDLKKGDVSGVFQLSAQSSKVMEQAPNNFRDLIAINALIRPGTGDWEEYIARKKGKAWDKDPNRPWMWETLGIMVYQEQFLLDAKNLCGWSVAFADKKIRKNKNIKADTELREKFISDGVNNGHSEAYMQNVWTEIENATGDYSFNKSHAASYARMSAQTAWLKHYYPAHFYASLMTSEGSDQDAVSKYVAECKARGIKIIPPDINHSGDDFVVRDNAIVYRITTISHVGESAINHIEQLRPISSFDDFMQRREKKYIKKNVLVNLIKAGCFDFDVEDRSELLWRVDMSERSKTQIKENLACLRPLWNDKMKAEWEKDALGMYLSYHPLERFGFKSFDSYANQADCLVGGEIINLSLTKDKRGKEMAFITLDTLFGIIRVVIFSSMWERPAIQEPILVGNLVLVKGKKDGTNVLLNHVEILE